MNGFLGRRFVRESADVLHRFGPRRFDVHPDRRQAPGFDGIPEGFRSVYPGKFGLFSDAPCNLFDAAGVTSVSRMLGEK
jgi:hypothetical protein